MRVRLSVVLMAFGTLVACSQANGGGLLGDSYSSAPWPDSPDGGGPVLSKPHGPLQPDLSDVTVAVDPPPPIFGGTLTISNSGDLAIVADPDRSQVHLVALGATNNVLTLQTGPHTLPFRVIEDGAHRAHVTLRGSGELLTIDLNSATIVARRGVCAEPRGLVWESARDLVHVACESGALVSFPAAGGPPVRSVTLPRGLRDVVVTHDGLLVSRFREATVVHVATDGTVGRESALASTGSRQNEVAWRMLPNPAGGAAILYQRATRSALDIQPQHPNGYGEQGCSAPSIESVISTVDSAPSGLSFQSFDDSTSLADMVLPVDFAIGPNRSMLVVAPANGHTPSLPGFSFFGPAEQPSAPCTPPFAVQFSEPHEFVAAAFDGLGRGILQSREPAALIVLDKGQAHKVIEEISLSSISRKDAGHTIFHSNSSGFLACASCHPEGGDDGHVWTFQDQTFIERRTPSLRGTVAGTAPYHWDGAFLTVSALANDVFTRRMGGPALDDRHTSALRSWIESIPAPRAETPADPLAASRGKELFDGVAGCSSCHAGPRFTNNLTVDVGTGAPMQTPSLIGVSAHAPYMHNGCAQTLEARFDVVPHKHGMPVDPTCDGGQAHGNASKLMPSQLADLITYLKTL